MGGGDEADSHEAHSRRLPERAPEACEIDDLRHQRRAAEQRTGKPRRPQRAGERRHDAECRSREEQRDAHDDPVDDEGERTRREPGIADVLCGNTAPPDPSSRRAFDCRVDVERTSSQRGRGVLGKRRRLLRERTANRWGREHLDQDLLHVRPLQDFARPFVEWRAVGVRACDPLEDCMLAQGAADHLGGRPGEQLVERALRCRRRDCRHQPVGRAHDAHGGIGRRKIAVEAATSRIVLNPSMPMRTRRGKCPPMPTRNRTLARMTVVRM